MTAASPADGARVDAGVLAERLRGHPRAPGDAVVTATGDLVEVRREDAVVLVAPAGVVRAGGVEGHLDGIAGGTTGLVFVGAPPDGFLAALPGRALVAVVAADAPADALHLAVAGLLERALLRAEDARRSVSLTRTRYELDELIDIARALSQERDIDRLLERILERSRFITGADAGSLYVVEGDGAALRFKLSQNDSLEFESGEFTMPVSTRSIAGAAAVTRRPINLPDVYQLPDDAPYGFDRSFDERVGYRTRSMIAVPMISAEDEVIGVIQLINKKRVPSRRLAGPADVAGEVVPFDERSEQLLQTLASQAGIALENALLYDEIRRIFEGFVRASVQAIEARDPTTSGHSLRVSVLSCRLAETVDRVDGGPYRQSRFSRRDLKELEYAALLHDFGKIGVRENVLVKAKKLYPHQLAAVRHRFEYAQKALEADVLRRQVALWREGRATPDALNALEAELVSQRDALDVAWRVVESANEPTVLSEGDFGKLREVARLRFVDPEGLERPVLTPEEMESLQVTKGSLNANEFDEIRSHVVHTFGFLSRIPWGKSYARIPEIAGAHHEKLDGTGYPNRLTADRIPLPSKIMTIADIFDALTARDRPYKRAMPAERALEILGFEVDAGHVDAELVRLFRDAGVYHEVEQKLEY